MPRATPRQSLSSCYSCRGDLGGVPSLAMAPQSPPVSMALCHEWTTVFGGAEQVSQRLAIALGIRDIFTFAADPLLVRALFPDSRIQAHKVGLTSFARKHWRWLLPLMPHAWKHLDLSSYDVVVTSSYACSNAIRTRPDSHHISYCHSPMRYAWDWQLEIGRLPPVLRPAWPLVAAIMKAADRKWTRGVTLFIATSRNIAGRIRRSYGRSSVVIHPPIDRAFWSPSSAVQREDFYLFAARLVPFKRADIAVEAATRSGVRLVVAGAGPELGRLKRRAGPNVEFLGEVKQDQLRELYRRTQAVLLPGVDDFPLAMLEAQSCGTPVIAFDAGGAHEAIRNGVTGLLYPDPSPASLGQVLRTFDPTRYSVSDIRLHTRAFDSRRFDAAVRYVVEATRNESVRVAATDDFAERLQKDLDVERE